MRRRLSAASAGQHAGVGARLALLHAHPSAQGRAQVSCSVVAGVGFSPPRSVNLPFCHLGLLKGRFSSL